MAKAPAFQFYVKDWLNDLELQACSASTRGIWINLLCWMWWNDTGGRIKIAEPKLLTIANCTQNEIDLFFCDSKKHKFCHARRKGDMSVTITNRRLQREEKAKKAHRLRQQKYRERRKGDADVTTEKQAPPSPSPSSTPKNTTSPNRKVSVADPIQFDWEKKEFVGITKEHIEKWSDTYPAVDIRQAIKMAREWQIGNPKKRKQNYYKFLVNWFTNNQEKGGARGYIKQEEYVPPPPGPNAVPDRDLTPEEIERNKARVRGLTRGMFSTGGV